MKITNHNGIISMLLTVSEDRATLRSDPSAVTEVSGKGDATGVTLFSWPLPHLSITLLRKPKSGKPWGLGQSPSKAISLSGRNDYSFSI